MTLRAPYPFFGKKSDIAEKVWYHLGQPSNYIEPFLGSGAMLLGRPNWKPSKFIETVNDIDGYICNFWRAIQKDPEKVAYYADYPTNEIDLSARHYWLITKGAKNLKLYLVIHTNTVLKLQVGGCGACVIGLVEVGAAEKIRGYGPKILGYNFLKIETPKK